MPIFIAILAIALIAGVVFLSKDSTDTNNDNTTEEVVRPTNDNSETDTETEETDDDGDEDSILDIEADSETKVNVAPPDTTEEETPPVASAGVNGTFTEKANYQTPAKTTQEIAVTLTIKDDIVTDAKVVYDNSPTYSNQNQERFDKAYKTEVVGKNIEEISLSRVGGASLTSGAFNEAVAKISTNAS